MVYRLVVPGPIEDVEEIRVLEWHKAEGSTVGAGELLVELETHKSVVEVRCTGAAVLRQVLCQEGVWQKIGNPLALLADTAAEPLPADAANSAPTLPVEFDVI